MAFRTVLFDLDGTLTDSGLGIIASVRFALEELATPPLDEAALRRFVGPPLADSFRDIAGLDAATAGDAVLAYRRRYAEFGRYENSVYPGIADVLEALRDDGRRLAVATSKITEFAVSICDHFELSQYFEAICGSDLAGARAAKADIVVDALAALGVAPGRDAVLVGDRSHDVVGARLAGIECVGAGWGYGLPGELVAAGATIVAADPPELAVILDAAAG